jgi:ribosomal protein S25
MKIVKKNKTYFINIKNEIEENLIENFLFKDIQIKKINEDVICFIQEKTNKKQEYPKENIKDPKENIKQKIIKLLNDKNLDFKNKIEGNFEKLLNKKDLEIFKEMLEKKEIVPNKLSSKYKKSFYQTNKKQNIKETTNDFNNFNTENYLIFKEDNLAQKFSFKYSQELKQGEIRGTKSFDGCYYVVLTSVFNKISKEILKLQKEYTPKEIAQLLKIKEDLAKSVLEILKEDCLVIEKKKGLYYNV